MTLAQIDLLSGVEARAWAEAQAPGPEPEPNGDLLSLAALSAMRIA